MNGVEVPIDALRSFGEQAYTRIGVGPATQGEGPYLPGELEDRKAVAATERGTISYPPSVARDLSALADLLGIEAPAQFRRPP